MSEPAHPEPLTREAFDAAYEPYALEIGFLLRDWNSLHEKLCLIFSKLLPGPNVLPCMTVWHSVPVDRFQRRMLKAACETCVEADDPAREGILWLIKATDGLGDERDTIAHSPITLLGPGPARMEAFDFLGNQRAGQLKAKAKNRGLFDEIKRCRAKASLLEDCAFNLFQYLARRKTPVPIPLPDKPVWPNAQKKK